MHTLRVLISCLKDPRILRPVCRFTSSSNLLSPILVDEQEDVETENDSFLHPLYPILCNRNSDLFYMPQSVGPAYQDLKTTADHFDINKYRESIGWNCVKPIRAQVVQCPRLMITYMKRAFMIPYSKHNDPVNYSIFNLYFENDVNSAIKSFVQIASQYSVDFMQDGYWSDFINPFTGRAYFRPATRRNMLKETNCLGHNMIIKDLNGCVVIKEAKKCTFAGSIFSDVPISYFK